MVASSRDILLYTILVSGTIRFGHVEDLEHALELHGKNVAAFLVEPIQGEAG